MFGFKECDKVKSFKNNKDTGSTGVVVLVDANGCVVIRTDDEGCVLLMFDNNGISVYNNEFRIEPIDAE